MQNGITHDGKLMPEHEFRMMFQYQVYHVIQCVVRIVDYLCQIIDGREAIVTSLVRPKRPGHPSFHPLITRPSGKKKGHAADIDSDKDHMSSRCLRAVKAILKIINWATRGKVQYQHEDAGTPNDHIHIEYDLKPDIMPV